MLRLSLGSSATQSDDIKRSRYSPDVSIRVRGWTATCKRKPFTGHAEVCCGDSAASYGWVSRDVAQPCYTNCKYTSSHGLSVVLLCCVLVFFLVFVFSVSCVFCVFC